MKPLYFRNKALGLRVSGYSYNYISEKTGISKSTLSGWLAKVPYTPNKETIERVGRARAASGASKHKLKVESFENAKKLAKKDIGKINRRDLFMLGLGVYIGEGTKFGDQVRVINSNPSIIRLSIKWFKRVCGLRESNFKIRLHIYPDNNEENCIKFWSEKVGLPKDSFRKTQIDLRKDKRMLKKGKLPFGTAHLEVKSNGKKEFGVFLGRRIRAWMDNVLQV